MAGSSSRKSPRRTLARMVASDRARSGVYKLANRLPPRARAAVLRTGWRVRDSLLEGRGRVGGGDRSPRTAPPKNFRVSPPPMPIRGDWAEPPHVAEPGKVVRTVLRKLGGADRYDVTLLEQLNEEYASKPLVPKPQELDTASRAERARRRLSSVHDAIDLRDKRVLEFGCGAGFEVWEIADHFGADAYGVDVIERAGWPALTGPRSHLVCADITEASPFEGDFFDRVISFSVFEHVARPYKALEELYRILKPGGLTWISANLYRSAVGSHLYRDLYFPYPHLLFTDEVIKEFYARSGRPDHGGVSWVNKLTWAQYERYFELIGFRTRMLRFSERDLDEEFYSRFEDVLGRYPRFDLTRDFFFVILEKPAG